jgi:hypothetical protein
MRVHRPSIASLDNEKRRRSVPKRYALHCRYRAVRVLGKVHYEVAFALAVVSARLLDRSRRTCKLTIVLLLACISR